MMGTCSRRVVFLPRCCQGRVGRANRILGRDGMRQYHVSFPRGRRRGGEDRVTQYGQNVQPGTSWGRVRVLSFFLFFFLSDSTRFRRIPIMNMQRGHVERKKGTNEGQSSALNLKNETGQQRDQGYQLEAWMVRRNERPLPLDLQNKRPRHEQRDVGGNDLITNIARVRAPQIFIGQKKASLQQRLKILKKSDHPCHDAV